MSTPQGPEQDDSPGRAEPPADGSTTRIPLEEHPSGDGTTAHVPLAAPDGAGDVPPHGVTRAWTPGDAASSNPAPAQDVPRGSETRTWTPSAVPPPPPAGGGTGAPAGQQPVPPSSPTVAVPAGQAPPPPWPGQRPPHQGGPGYAQQPPQQQPPWVGQGPDQPTQQFGPPQGHQQGYPPQQQYGRPPPGNPYGQAPQSGYGPAYPPGPQPGQPYSGAWAPPQAPPGPARRRRLLPLLIGGVLALVAVAVLVLGFVTPGWWVTRVFDQVALSDGVSRVLTGDYGYPGVGGVVCGDPASGPIEVVEGATFECTAVVDGATVRVPVRVTDAEGGYEVSRPAL